MASNYKILSFTRNYVKLKKEFFTNMKNLNLNINKCIECPYCYYVDMLYVYKCKLSNKIIFHENDVDDICISDSCPLPDSNNEKCNKCLYLKYKYVTSSEYCSHASNDIRLNNIPKNCPNNKF